MRAGDVAVVLGYCLVQWNLRVEYVYTASGYRSVAVNNQSGGMPTSNHLSATADDINGYKHPYEATHRRTFKINLTPQQIAIVRDILAFCEGTVEWGMDFPAGWRDPMHIAISRHTNGGEVARIADKIKSIRPPIKPPPPVLPPKPAPIEESDVNRDMIVSYFIFNLGRVPSEMAWREKIERAGDHGWSAKEIHDDIANSPEGKLFAAKPKTVRDAAIAAAIAQAD
jgi:hypothetical protein